MALIPWILDIELGLISIKAFAIYGGIVIAFLGGFIWGWDDQANSSLNLWYAIGFSLMGLSTALLAGTYNSLSLILMIGCYQDDDNEKLILAKFIGVEQNENLIYPVFTNQVKHYAIDINDPNTTYLNINE